MSKERSGVTFLAREEQGSQGKVRGHILKQEKSRGSIVKC
jgi:hypothetical protein